MLRDKWSMATLGKKHTFSIQGIAISLSWPEPCSPWWENFSNSSPTWTSLDNLQFTHSLLIHTSAKQALLRVHLLRSTVPYSTPLHFVSAADQNLAVEPVAILHKEHIRKGPTSYHGGGHQQGEPQKSFYVRYEHTQWTPCALWNYLPTPITEELDSWARCREAEVDSKSSGKLVVFRQLWCG